METLDDTQVREGVQFSPTALAHLRGTTPWMKFMAILGFIFSAIMGLGSIGIFIAGSKLGNGMAALSLIYVVFTAIYVWLSLLIYQQASSISSFLMLQDLQSLELAFAKQKTFWMTVGIMTILAFVFSITFLVFFASSMAGLMQPRGF
jgi:hypothetical protein